MLELESYDENNKQSIITDAVGLKWSTHYGESGSGYGYLKFSLLRKVGCNYRDIGYGYEVKLRKYLNTILFHGQIRQIEEKSGSKGDEITVTCLGQVVVAQDDEMLRAFCDTRIDMWNMESEIPKGSFRPDKFGVGSGTLGLYLHANNNAAAAAADYTELVYKFFEGEVAERFKCDFSLCLGAGTAFDGTISSISGADVVYTNDSGEGSLAANMSLHNFTQGKHATIQSVNTGTNTITAINSGALAGWVATDELAVYGPLFSAQIDSMSSDVITYAGDIVGEANLANGQVIVNISKKAVATINAFDTGANTITVTDEDHIDGWEVNDVIVVCAPYFSATFVSDSGVTITYSSPVGERIASSTTGWVLYNATEDEYAIVYSWNISANQLDVTDAGDITANWTNGDDLRIYTPYNIQILDSADTVLWPETDWREGAVIHNRTAIDILTTGSPTGLKIRYTCYIAGAGNESSFAWLSNIRAYSTEDDVTATMLAKHIVSILSVSGHDLSSSEDEIETIARVVEPMVFEFVSPAEALTSICKFGDVSGNPLAWGIRLDDNKELFLEAQDSVDVEYIIRASGPQETSVSGDVQESIQQVRAVYTDKTGKQQMTDWLPDTDAYFANRYRRKSIRLDNVDTEAEADTLAQIYLDENKAAKTAIKLAVSAGSILNVAGAPMPFDEIMATGGYAQIEDWPSRESTGLQSVNRLDESPSELVTVVEIDYDSGKVSLTLAGAKSDFEQYMAELALMAQR